MKRILSLALVLVMVLSFAGCSVKDTKDKVFTCDELSITLNEGYTETEMEGYNACFDSTTVAVFILKEEFSLMEGFGDYTIDQYADLVATANSARNPKMETVDGMKCMTYSYYNSEKATTYKYFATLYKADTAFWMVQFACREEDYADHYDYFVERSKTVTFS